MEAVKTRSGICKLNRFRVVVVRMLERERYIFSAEHTHGKDGDTCFVSILCYLCFFSLLSYDFLSMTRAGTCGQAVPRCICVRTSFVYKPLLENSWKISRRCEPECCMSD